MLQPVPEGILLFKDGRCVDQNAGAVALLGYSTGGELRGCTLSRLSVERQADGGGRGPDPRGGG